LPDDPNTRTYDIRARVTALRRNEIMVLDNLESTAGIVVVDGLANEDSSGKNICTEPMAVSGAMTKSSAITMRVSPVVRRR
jgi:hypothetical protein